MRLKSPTHQHTGRSMNKERRYVPHEDRKRTEGLVVASSSRLNVQINIEGKEGHGNIRPFRP